MEKVEVVGEGYSDRVEERERWFPRVVELEESIATLPSSLLRASTSCGSMSGFNSRPRMVSAAAELRGASEEWRGEAPLCWVRVCAG